MGLRVGVAEFDSVGIGVEVGAGVLVGVAVGVGTFIFTTTELLSASLEV